MNLRATSLALCCLALAACSDPSLPGHVTDITGAMPRLEFHMTRARDGASVTADDYRGKVTILYFGYTHCPDICPATLANLSEALRRLRQGTAKVRILFVTVDPTRDTPTLLKNYTEAFAPEIDGLRGSDDALAALARRYRVTYGVTPASPGHPYSVMHSDAVFFFDSGGRARLVATSTDDVPVIAADITHLYG